MELDEKDWMREEGKVQNGIIRIVHRYFAIIFRQILKYGIHPGQVPMLMLLVKKEGMSQSEICKEMHIKPSTVAVSMKRMEKSGLIMRKPDLKDQRIQRIYTTKKLREIHSELHALIRSNEEIIMQGFTESEICLLNRFFDQIYENLNRLPVPEGEDLKLAVVNCGMNNQEEDMRHD